VTDDERSNASLEREMEQTRERLAAYYAPHNRALSQVARSRGPGR